MITKYQNFLSHHAVYIIGDVSSHTKLMSILENDNKLKIHGNPDLFDRTYESFAIDDARELKTVAMMRPTKVDDGKGTTTKKIFVLTMNGITVEAQNALLKLLEEPPTYVYFFLIIPSAHLLLPTVKSRMQEIQDPRFEAQDLRTVDHGKRTGNSMSRVDTDYSIAEAFLKMTQTKRLESVKSLIDSISKEKKTKQDAVDFINVLEEIVHSKGLKSKNVVKSLEAIELARTYMNDRSPSMKMLLEYVAMSVSV